MREEAPKEVGGRPFFVAPGEGSSEGAQLGKELCGTLLCLNTWAARFHAKQRTKRSMTHAASLFLNNEAEQTCQAVESMEMALARLRKQQAR